ncbi:ATP-binding protein [Mucilaginibacter celer]|uniref:histidine kinase n=1 Tax=Mucilaginibacter celer TaxID=2305508 RepID=A0A494VYH5_9SPHI|nr:ATP-binding protein [Mucilaginibacter celer]AYL96215.1 PAS domain S-box protein [Mucilaginibacter celer]
MDNSPYLLTDKQLIEVLCMTQSPTAVHVSEDAVIQAANDAMINVWGKDRSVIGKSLADALPELKGQPFIDMFKRVWNEGITFTGTDTPANLVVNGELQTFYFDFEYKPIKDGNGKTYAILHTANDVTERYLGRHREQHLIEELTATNEELTAANEEVRASNEELAAINEELQAITEELRLSEEFLQNANNELSASENRFRQLIAQAPVGICLIGAHDFMVQEVNNAYLQLVGRPREFFEGRTIWQIVPEAEQTYAPIMNGVIETGIAYAANEHRLILSRAGADEEVLVNFVYEPILGQDGQVSAIMVLAIEVTDMVTARKKIEQAEERSRLAVDAAGIGIFDLDLQTGIPVVSGKFNEIFDLDSPPGKDTIEPLIHPDDRQTRADAHAEALQSGQLFYEARLWHQNGPIRWVRAQGKVFYKSDNAPDRILGTVLDITAYKELQQQKDDFISIASHELKTPITSLKASLQLMDRIKDKSEQTMIPKLIMQSRKSVERVSALVEDLLNVSRLQQSDIRLNKSHFILSQLVNAVANPISIIAKHKIIITGNLELQVYADEHRIDQVLTNFLNNAVKYAPSSETIEVDIHTAEDYVTVSVTDYGPGIPFEKQQHLFDRYYRVDPSGHQGSGLGLGLYICEEIITRHNGSIGVNSVEGKGSTFWFRLPL